jgi:hypothetical protein
MERKVNITLSTRPGFAWQCANFWRVATGRAAILKRYWSHVKREHAKGADCWLWSGSVSRTGHGRFEMGERFIAAHRLAWRIARGPIPTRWQPVQRCGHLLCVNPSHMSLGRVYQSTHQPVNHESGSACS